MQLIKIIVHSRSKVREYVVNSVKLGPIRTMALLLKNTAKQDVDFVHNRWEKGNEHLFLRDLDFINTVSESDISHCFCLSHSYKVTTSERVGSDYVVRDECSAQDFVNLTGLGTPSQLSKTSLEKETVLNLPNGEFITASTAMAYIDSVFGNTLKLKSEVNRDLMLSAHRMIEAILDADLGWNTNTLDNLLRKKTRLYCHLTR